MAMAELEMAPVQRNMLAIFRRKRLLAMSVPVVIFAYFVYIFIAFDVAGLASRARMDNVGVLLSDFWSRRVRPHDEEMMRRGNSLKNKSPNSDSRLQPPTLSLEFGSCKI